MHSAKLCKVHNYFNFGACLITRVDIQFCRRWHQNVLQKDNRVDKVSPQPQCAEIVPHIKHVIKKIIKRKCSNKDRDWRTIKDLLKAMFVRNNLARARLNIHLIIWNEIDEISPAKLCCHIILNDH